MFDELIEAGLVTQKRYPNGLSVFKYARRVFFEHLWDTDPLLLEARGMVLDDEGDKIIWPFTKIFNYGEKQTGLDLFLEEEVQMVRKINGFMAAATWYHDELVVSTTGTLDSEYALMARDYIEEMKTRLMVDGHTYIFEICSPDDPHIVKEKEGAYLIGCRDMQDGRMLTEDELDGEAIVLGCMRPEHTIVTWREGAMMAKLAKHEGYVVRDPKDGRTIMKIKSPHYLAKKFIMRMGQKKIDMMFDDKENFLKFIDEEFYPIVHHITRWFTPERWKGYPEQERRAIIEEYFNGTL